MDKVNEYYGYFMELSTFKKAVVVLIVALVAYYAYKHFWLREGMEDGEDGVLRFFYADWCPHCKSAKPEWDRLKKMYKGKTVLKEENCSKKPTAMAKKLGVEGYPTFILSKSGKNLEYDGDRNAAGLHKFLKSN